MIHFIRNRFHWTLDAFIRKLWLDKPKQAVHKFCGLINLLRMPKRPHPADWHSLPVLQRPMDADSS